MQISKIVRQINQHLAGEFCSPAELITYMDRVIDDINTRLNACFPTFSEHIANNAETTDPDYNVFPDKYIRSVVVTGSAYKFYVTDEEGSVSAQQYGSDYNQNLFYVERDYSFSIPEMYREADQGFVNDSDKDAGLWLSSVDIC